MRAARRSLSVIVTCEQCSSRFRLDDDKIGPEGAKVRCSKCKHAFVVRREDDLMMVDDAMLVEDDATQEVAPAEPPPADGEATVTVQVPQVHQVHQVRRLTGDDITVVGGAAAGPPRRPSLIPGFNEAPTGVLPPQGPQDLSDEATVPGPSATPAPAEVDDDPRDPFASVTREISTQEARAAIARAAAESVHEQETQVRQLSVQVTESNLTAARLSDGGDPGASTGQRRRRSGDLEAELFSDLPEPDSDPVVQRPFDLFATSDLTGSTAGQLPELGDLPAPPAERHVMGQVVGWGVASLSALVLLSGIAYFFVGDWVRAQAGRASPVILLPNRDGARIGAVRSTYYPTAGGERVLVLFGEVENRTDADLSNLHVVAELRDPQGTVRASSRAPVAVPLDPGALHRAADQASLVAAFGAALPAEGDPTVPAGQAAPFTLVIQDPPPSMTRLTPALRIERGNPWPRPEPVGVAAATDVPEGDGAGEAVAEGDEELDEDGLRRGKKRRAKPQKGKRKGKAKGKRGKRKAEAEG